MRESFRVAIYLRLSIEDKDKLNRTDDSESIKNQRHMLMEVINNNPSYNLVCEYCDEDLSGAGTFRPEFERLIKDCENGKIDIVLCKSQSRFSRDMEIVERYINNKFKEWNVRFISLSDNADTENPGNKKSRQINGLVNEWYLEDVSNNIRSAFNSKMKQGEFISPFAPFGYLVDSNDNNKLVVDKVVSLVVKDIFNLYLKGYGYSAIAKYLNDKNIPSPSLYKYRQGIKLNVVSNKKRDEIKWNSNAIKTILKNEVYLGKLVQGKRTTVSYKNHKIINKDKSLWISYPNTHEAIIDKDTFYKVQKEMKNRTKPRSSNTVHLFSGKAFCLDCGHYLRKKNSSRHEYLVCSNNVICSNKSSIRYDKLESIVLSEVNKLLDKFYDEELLKDKVNKKYNEVYKEKIESLESELVNINRKIDESKDYLQSLYEDKVNDVISTQVFNTLISNYEDNLNKYYKQLNDVNKKINIYKDNIKSFDDKIISKYKKLDCLNRVSVNEFIDKIYVGKVKDNIRNIKIKWNL